MKKTIRMFFAALATFLAFSCAVENPENPQFQGDTLEFTAELESTEVKTSLAQGTKVIWNLTDEISVFNGTASSPFQISDLDADARTAHFTGTLPTAERYWAIYPNQAGLQWNAGEVTAVIPTVQTPAAGSFADAASLAVAEVEGQSLHFKNVGALLAVTINNDNIASVRIASGDATALTGPAAITIAATPSVKVAAEVKDYVELQGELIKGNTYYAVVYPGTQANGFVLTYTDKQGRTATVSQTKAIDIQRNANIRLVNKYVIPEDKWVTPAPAEPVYTLVTDEKFLQAGDIVCIAEASKGKVLGVPSSKQKFFVPGTATFAQGQMTQPVDHIEFTLGGQSGAWTFNTANGSLYSSDTKIMKLHSSATSWEIRFETNGDASIRCNAGRILYNVNDPRFTTYTSRTNENMLLVQLYKKNWDAPAENGKRPAITYGEMTMTGITSSGVQLMQLYSDASAVPAKVGFHYATDRAAFDNARFEYIEAPAVSAENGSFQIYLNGLSPNRTYYVRPYAKVYGTGDYATENQTFNGEIKSFKTASGSVNPDPDQPGGGDNPGGSGANGDGHLINYEIPHADVNVPEGQAYSSAVNERGGSTKAYIYETMASGQRIVTHTFMNNSRVHRNYTFLYDYEKKLPLWLAYPMNRGYCGTGGTRTDAWGYDPAIPSEHQPNLHNSYGSGYNRGHMLASHSRSAITEANRQTFYYTNMTPQDERYLNTGAGSWNKLESHEMNILPSGNDTLYVVTGCTFDEPVKWITNKAGQRCAVPKECYKCFMMCSFDNQGKMLSAKGIGYLMPNDVHGKGDYAPFAKTIDEIEAITGFDLFANVPKQLQDAAESKKTVL